MVPHHLSAVLMNILASTKLEHVPYRGEAPAITDILGGTVDDVPYGDDGTPEYRVRRTRALAVTSRRNPALPEVPTVMESGVQNFEVRSWNALMGPAKFSTDCGSPKHCVE